MPTVPPPPPLPSLPTHLGSTITLGRQMKISRTVFKSMEQLQSASRSSKGATRPFNACHLCLYGTLQDLDVRQATLNLPKPPRLHPANFYGFSVKMWGIHPGLIPQPTPSSSTTIDSSPAGIAGIVWYCASKKTLAEDAGVRNVCIYLDRMYSNAQRRHGVTRREDVHLGWGCGE
jgi:hypothetical protein